MRARQSRGLYSMNRAHLLLISALCVLAPGDAQAQPRGRDGIALTKTPAVVVVTQRDDARVALVREAVAHWNRVLARIGSSFRLGPVSIRSGGTEAAEPGKIVVVLSDDVFISHVNRLPGGQGALVIIRSDRVPPLSKPNVARNVIAHELGHAIGLGHNSDPAMMMCGRPAPCRPDGCNRTDRGKRRQCDRNRRRWGGRLDHHCGRQHRRRRRRHLACGFNRHRGCEHGNGRFHGDWRDWRRSLGRFTHLHGYDRLDPQYYRAIG
jgi:hypothetical protein